MKRQHNLLVAALLATVAGIAIFAGCGSNSSDATTSQAEASTPTEAGSSGASFISAKGKNKIPRFGQEAGSDDREAASAVLQQNQDARAARDWQGQCDTLTVALVKEYEKRAKFYKAGKTCAQGLGFEAKEAPAAVLANTMTGPVDVLRIDGDRAYALYHGPKGVNYAMPMRLEDGEWRVAEVKTITLPK